MSVELGSIWIDNDSDLLVIVKNLEGHCDGKVKVVFNYVVRTGDKSVESASELDLFLKTKTKLVKDGGRDYSKGYEDGYDSGRNQWQDEYGFTVPNNTISSLESAAYAKGLKDKESINHSVKNGCFKKGFEKGKEFNKDNQNLNYRIGYNDGWYDCEASFELGNEFTDSIQEQAYDEGYDQAIDDLIESGVIGEEEYLDDYSDDDYSDEDYSEDDYSEYEFGDVEDDEEEYCFFKEIERVLNGKFELNTKSEDVERKHSHYFKDVRHLDYVDIYQVCKLFEVEDPSHCTQHSIKKLLMSGKRGAKDKMKDIIEARDTLNRYLQIEGVEE